MWQEQEQVAGADNDRGSPPFSLSVHPLLLLPTAPELVPEEGLKPSTSGL